jgi:hypothetical protein
LAVKGSDANAEKAHKNRARITSTYRISKRLGGRGGCFDVFAWQNGDVIFCEAKRLKRDTLRLSQRKWIEAAICEGVPLSSIIIVEWTSLHDPPMNRPTLLSGGVWGFGHRV